MPHHNFPSQRGDLFVDFTVAFPDALASELAQGLAALLR